jgi:hypothetical protein
LAVGALGLASCRQTVLGWQLPIDEWWVADLALLPRGARVQRVVRLLSAAVIVGGVASLLGHLWDSVGTCVHRWPS